MRVVSPADGDAVTTLRERLIERLLRDGLAEESPGYGHATAEEVADAVLEEMTTVHQADAELYEDEHVLTSTTVSILTGMAVAHCACSWFASGPDTDTVVRRFDAHLVDPSIPGDIALADSPT